LLPGSEVVFCDTEGDVPELHDLMCAFASLAKVPDLVTHYRSGTGLPFADYGDDMRTSQALATRRGYRHDLEAIWLPALGETFTRLQDSGRRIVDIGFGAGWSTIALARAFPRAEIVGLDLDPASVALAQANAQAEGLGERITFAIRDAASPDLGGQFDLVCIFEALHDLGRPVPALRALRQMLAPGGCVLTGDPGEGDVYVAPGNDDARILAGFSLTHCLPVGMDGPEAVGTGARMRPATVRSYARAAGFTAIEQLPIPHPSWLFFRLGV